VVIVSVIAMLQVPGSLFPPEDESRSSFRSSFRPVRLAGRHGCHDRRHARRDQGHRRGEIRRWSSAAPPRLATATSAARPSPSSSTGWTTAGTQADRPWPRLAPGRHLIPEIPSEGRLRPQVEIEAEVFAALKAIPDVRAFKVSTMAAPGARPFSL
jgi:hypothetical protein